MIENENIVQFNVPLNIEDGNMIKFSGAANEVFNGIPGDLLIKVNVFVINDFINWFDVNENKTKIIFLFLSLQRIFSVYKLHFGSYNN